MENCNFDKICRICLNQDPSKDLSVKHKKFDVDYYFLLNVCGSIQAELTDKLPNKICIKCEKGLTNSFKLRKIIIESDKKLKETLEQEKLIENELIRTTVKPESNVIDKNEIYIKPEKDIENVETCESEDGNFEIDDSDDEELNETLDKTKNYCEKCNKSFSCKSNVVRHMRKHNTEKLFQCEMCVKSFRRLDHLNVHKRIHTGEKPAECTICYKKFSQVNILKNHMRTHSGEKPFMCTVCGKSFAHLITLTNHSYTHTGETPYKCDLCNKAFRNSGNLHSHVRFVHKNERNYECIICKQSFGRSKVLKDHMVIHTGERPYSCKFCSNTYKHSSHLARHKRTHVFPEIKLYDT